MNAHSHLVEVNLHGQLGEQFGRVHHFNIHSPREAEHAPVLPVSKEIHLVPKVEGSSFLAPLVGGAVLGIGSTTLTAQIVGGLLMSALFIGLSMLIAPKPKDEEETKDQN